MKRFISLCLVFLVYACFIVLSGTAYAATGETILVKINVISDTGNNRASYVTEDSTKIEPLFVSDSPDVENAYLCVYTLKEGTGHYFRGVQDAGGTFSILFYPVKGVDYIADITNGKLSVYSGPDTAASAPSSSGAGKASSEKETVKPSDAGAIVLADIGAPSPQGDPGEMVMFTLSLVVNREYLPTEKYVLRNITIEPLISAEKYTVIWPFEIENASYIRRLDDMAFGERANVAFEFRISESAAKGTYVIPFKLNATVWRYDPVNGTTISEDVEFTLLQYVKVLQSGADSGKAIGIGAIDIAAAGAAGKTIPAPTCKNGERIRLRLPLVSRSSLTDVTVTPVLSANVDECPIVSESVNYGQTLLDMKKGETITLEYDFKVSQFATKGNRPIKFKATYLENGAAGECTLTAYINVTSGYEKDTDAKAGSATGLTVESYTLVVGGERENRLFAGDSAILTLKIRNNGAQADGLRVRVSMDASRLLLDTGQSDTQYVSSVAKGDMVSLGFAISAPRDAAQGAAGMTVAMSCEGAAGAQTKETQTLQIPIKQRVKVALDAPVISGDGYQPLLKDEPIPMRCRIVNLGRAKIYNARLEVRGGGLSMCEGYYGTDVPPLSDLYAGFKIVSSLSGERSGTLALLYEDEDGRGYEQSVDLSVTVEERGAMRDAAPGVGNTDSAQPPTPVAGIIGAALFVSSVSALAYTRLKRGRGRRRRYF